jgi:hypothetical protein
MTQLCFRTGSALHICRCADGRSAATLPTMQAAASFPTDLSNTAPRFAQLSGWARLGLGPPRDVALAELPCKQRFLDVRPTFIRAWPRVCDEVTRRRRCGAAGFGHCL